MLFLLRLPASKTRLIYFFRISLSTYFFDFLKLFFNPSSEFFDRPCIPSLCHSKNLAFLYQHTSPVNHFFFITANNRYTTKRQYISLRQRFAFPDFQERYPSINTGNTDITIIAMITSVKFRLTIGRFPKKYPPVMNSITHKTPPIMLYAANLV